MKRGVYKIRQIKPKLNEFSTSVLQLALVAGESQRMIRRNQVSRLLLGKVLSSDLLLPIYWHFTAVSLGLCGGYSETLRVVDKKEDLLGRYG